ncbi:MAG: 5-formyltetrahydrofolate cyclo-ligase [Candidatus Omnitrophica bacterium]|nr:5-formyltetrahydrofolate cyclo-ligase [Candidatus Omnitrophota bacterium]MBU4488290.1 5-formyltetrahydrofolate cyclo-ligase [Candidatus Omnitrophota bacterium]MCG2704494.1 5-formyltetrahydrofolate cyclo-ligase [Candidatus Omnitrophota bacterium]
MVDLLKRKIRKETLDRLYAINKKDKEQKVNILRRKLFSLTEFKEAKCVMFYVSKPYEVDTHEMIDESIQMGKKVVVPITVKEEKTLKLSELKDREKELIRSHYGIHQPGEKHVKPVSLEEVDLMVVPGIAFDRHGHRLGHGGGYFDRFLHKAPPRLFTVGLAFDFQLVDELPRYDTDIPLNKILVS